MIHGGLTLNLHEQNTTIGHCCLRNLLIEANDKIWDHPDLIPLRQLNSSGQWDTNCKQICKGLEDSGAESFRTGMNRGLQIQGKTDLSGPARIDLLFDNSCNLACRTCGPQASTYWQKHLKDNNMWSLPIQAPKKKNVAIDALKQLDLSNLRQLVFCGGETLLGNAYWEVAEWLSNNVPNCKQQLTLCFQTNATQNIKSKHYELIEKFFLVKLHCSIDGVGDRFNYLRWPADWKQTSDNLFSMRENLPSNVMFVLEETISIFNLMYLNEVDDWHKNHFSVNREGDLVNCTKHVAAGIFGLHNCTDEYKNLMKNTKYASLIDYNSAPDELQIKKMIDEIKKFDSIRSESFKNTFPEVAECYKNYI